MGSATRTHHLKECQKIKLNTSALVFPLTALEGDVRVETLESVRAIVHTTYPLAVTTSRLCILIGEDSMAARLNLRTQALIRMRGGRTTSLKEKNANVSIGIQGKRRHSILT